jgi:uncharacterized protein YejL (UPF0352 family)
MLFKPHRRTVTRADYLSNDPTMVRYSQDALSESALEEVLSILEDHKAALQRDRPNIPKALMAVVDTAAAKLVARSQDEAERRVCGSSDTSLFYTAEHRQIETDMLARWMREEVLNAAECGEDLADPDLYQITSTTTEAALVSGSVGPVAQKHVLEISDMVKQSGFAVTYQRKLGTLLCMCDSDYSFATKPANVVRQLVNIMMEGLCTTDTEDPEKGNLAEVFSDRLANKLGIPTKPEDRTQMAVTLNATAFTVAKALTGKADSGSGFPALKELRAKTRGFAAKLAAEEAVAKLQSCGNPEERLSRAFGVRCKPLRLHLTPTGASAQAAFELQSALAQISISADTVAESLINLGFATAIPEPS